MLETNSFSLNDLSTSQLVNSDIMITVEQNAYLRKAQMHDNYSELHKRILFVLIHEKKHYSKEELMCFTQENPILLDNALKDLEDAGIVNCEGWLVCLKDSSEFNKEICEELSMIE